MELQDLAIAHFHDHLGASAEAAETLPSDVAMAAELLFACLVNDGKILICGDGHHSANASHLCNALMSRHGQDRPPLPAIHIGANSGLLTTLMHQNPNQELLARQITTLGQAGDMLVVLAGPQDSSAVVQAVQAAHAQDMQAIVISSQQMQQIDAVLAPDDLTLRVPGERFATLLQQQLMVVLMLSDLIDHLLFGSNE
ncbi:MAG: SIS domain-containing protein [Gammaproteobacteria bacterium]|jgi:D-sedoheptulose 7-phosphate isomerase|nr:SIS domain-containing protein [Gammaproteobacteria bacterium]MCP4881917.1 SIS domain-containing protein [Gammaproteobacteria bacterium]MDP6165146.1 SIS domain-containing protein [Gammaproteobacteria bacterium]